jgi:hypothetical protein
MALSEEIRALERLDLQGLRAVWREKIGPAPTMRSVDLVCRMLAWKLQAQVLGGFDGPTLRLLRASPRKIVGAGLAVGARIAREWKGVRHEVEVTEDGFRHDGQTYASLSQAARAITGTNWNGPRFFGLRETTAP